MVLSTDGSLYGIGTGKNGLFGDRSLSEAFVPEQLNVGSTWTSIATANSHTIGIKNDGSLWTWGLNTSGQLGIGDAATRSSPTAVLTGKSFVAVAGGGTGASHAIANNGIMWAFGAQSASLNQLGVGGLTANRSFPQQVGEKWNMIKAGLSHVAAIDAEGGLWVWGVGINGCLGLGDTTNKNVMTKINESSWSFVSCGQNITMAITTDGKLWTWGTNTVGQLGNNNTLNRF
jgi:alpha-tubulin suppressor-like RCC1 family protein